MASKIKISVVDKESNFRLWLPPIPFWLITSLTSIALRFAPRIIKDTGDEDNSHWVGRVVSSLPITSKEPGEINSKISSSLNEIDNKMIKRLIKEIIYELRRHGKFDLVDISTDDGTKVKISII